MQFVCICAFQGTLQITSSNSVVLLGRFGYFLFFCSGEGKRESEAPGGARGGDRFFLPENPTRRGLAEGAGADGQGRCLQGICGGGGGWGLIFYFGGGGAKFSPRMRPCRTEA